MIRLLVLVIHLLIFAPALEAAAQGSTREDRNAVQGLEDFQEGVITDRLPEAVDLRPFLPQVGEQTMNDCAAWAFGYAGRSYLEAIDQGWKPDQPDRIFSPTFIYNQVNGGVDSGSRVDHVLELLMNKGAATLSTAPYLPKDFLTPPPDAATEEAKVFRIADFAVLENGPAIRAALAEGHIVLCCVRTNPIFSGGHARPYTADKHRQGQAARRPDQPHGFHAMAIVGYSDQRQAFLFMNSWGKGWGENGFLWVSYDVLESFNTAEETTKLMDFALVMLDRHETLVKTDGHYQVVELDSLEPHLFAAYAGQDAKTGAATWRFTLSLRGSDSALSVVNSVDWTVPGLNGEQTIASDSAGSSFRLIGRSLSPEISISGIAHLSNGKQVVLTSEVSIPDSKKRDLSLERIDAFYSKEESGEHLWRWTLVPQMSDTDWSELKSVRWHLDGVAENQDKIYNHDGGLPPKWSMESLAMPSFFTGEPQGCSATFEFQDGSFQVREFEATSFSSEVLDHSMLEYKVRQEGADGGRGWHFLEMRARYPESWKDEILGVRMSTGTHATWRDGAGRQVGGPEPYMHVHGSYVDGPFYGTSMLFFRDESLGFGNATPARSPGKVDLGAASDWHDPWPEGENLDAPGRGFGLNYRDRFVGMVDGQPVWATEVFLDGNANHNIIKEITWEFDHGVTADAEAQKAIYAWDAYRRKCLRTSKPFQATAHCVDFNGFAFDLSLDVIPRSTANTAMAVSLTSVPVPELETNTPQQVLADVGVIGMKADLKGLRSIRAWPKRSWGGVLPVQLKWWMYNAPIEDSFARLEVRADEPTMVLMEYDDGSVVALESQPHSLAPVATAPPLQIFAREKFLGWQDGKPTWQVDIDLRGNLSALGKLQNVDWEVREVGASKAMDLGLQAKQQRFQIQTSQAARIKAVVKFEDEAGLTEQHLEALVTTLSPRFKQGISVRMERAWTLDLDNAINRGDAGEYFNQEYPYRFRIMGSPQQLQQIKEVHYSLQSRWGIDGAARDERAEPLPLVKRIAGVDGIDNYFSYELDCGIDDEWLVTPSVIFKDGTTKVFDVLTAGTGPSSQEYTPRLHERFTTVRDWGIVDGKQASLMLVRVPPSAWTDHLMRLELEFDKEVIPAGGSPAASFDYGYSLREFLIYAETAVQELHIVRREPRYSRFEMDDVEVKWPSMGVVEPLKKTKLRITSEAGDGTVHFVSLEIPASMDGKVQRVSYDVKQDGKRTVYLPLGKFGEHSSNFELKLYGSKPTSIGVRLFGESGYILGSDASWKR